MPSTYSVPQHRGFQAWCGCVDRARPRGLGWPSNGPEPNQRRGHGQSEKASKSRRATVHAVASVHKRPQKRGAPGAVRLAVRFDRFAFGRAVVE